MPCPYKGRKIITKQTAEVFKGRIIELDGGMGSGKSSLGREMVDILSRHGVIATYIPEHIEHPLFNFMLDNPKEYAFAYQMIMLKQRIHTHQTVMSTMSVNPDACIIIDRGLIGDMSFEQLHHARGNITDEQDAIYRNTIVQNAHHLCEPDLILRIRCDTSLAKSRIEKRDRVGEKVYKIEDLNDLEVISNGLFESKNFSHLLQKVHEMDNNEVYSYLDFKNSDKMTEAFFNKGERETKELNHIEWGKEAQARIEKSIMTNKLHSKLADLAKQLKLSDERSGLSRSDNVTRQSYYHTEF